MDRSEWYVKLHDFTDIFRKSEANVLAMLIFLWEDGAPFENIMMNNMNAEFPPQVNPTVPPSLLQNKSLASSLGVMNGTFIKSTTDV